MFQALLLVALAQGVSDDRILIGMEGPANSFSVDEENLGMRLVIRQANESGGIPGRLLVEKAYPRGSDDPVGQAVRNAQRLVEQDGVFLLFNFGGPAAVRIGEYAMERDVPYLFPHTALLTVDGDRHIFTSYPRYDGESRMMLEFLVRERQAKRIAVVHAPNIYGDYFAGRAATLADEIGYEFVGAESLPIQPAQANSEMRALRDRDPDAVVMALYPAGARRVVEAKEALECEHTLVTSVPLTDEHYLNVDGCQAEGKLGFCD